MDNIQNVINKIRTKKDNLKYTNIIIFDDSNIIYNKFYDNVQYHVKLPMAINSSTVICTGCVIMMHQELIPNIFNLSMSQVWGVDINTAYHNVTIESLVSHRSGISDNINLSKLDSLFDINKMLYRQEISRSILMIPPMYEPMTKIKYSNINLIILIACIEKIRGIEYHRDIFESVYKHIQINPQYLTVNIDGYIMDQLLLSPLELIKYCQIYLKQVVLSTGFTGKKIIEISHNPLTEKYFGGWSVSYYYNHVIYTHHFSSGDYQIVYVIIPSKTIGYIIWNYRDIDVDKYLYSINKTLIKNK